MRANESLIQILNEELVAGQLFNQLGIQVETKMEAGLVNESLSCFIMVRNEIPELCPDTVIPIDHLELAEPS